jgi:hypothetical protein
VAREDRVEFVDTNHGDQFTENKGYTLDSGFEMPTVATPPSQPATPAPPVETQGDSK